MPKAQSNPHATSKQTPPTSAQLITSNKNALLLQLIVAGCRPHTCRTNCRRGWAGSQVANPCSRSHTPRRLEQSSSERQSQQESGTSRAPSGRGYRHTHRQRRSACRQPTCSPQPAAQLTKRELTSSRDCSRSNPARSTTSGQQACTQCPKEAPASKAMRDGARICLTHTHPQTQFPRAARKRAGHVAQAGPADPQVRMCARKQ